jgi:hypothetical protein
VKSLDEKIGDATVGDIEDLTKEIAGIESHTKRAAYASALAKKLRVNKKCIFQDVKRFRGDDTTENGEPVFSANFDGLVDIVTDESGEVAYLVKQNDTLLVLHDWEVDGTVYVPPARKHLPFELSRAEAVLKWHMSDNNAQLFRDVLTYLKRFSYLPDEQWLIVACVVFLSYIQEHEDIHYLPELLFYAVPERGKSRTGKAVIYIAYRGVHTVELREANLFRFSNDLSATIFFDIMDLWKKAERNGCEDIMLGRYEKGQTVARVIFPEKGAFKDTKYYKVYGPTLIATNESLHKILDTRCIPITMPNKPGRYESPTREKAQYIKERLTAWRARMIDVLIPTTEPVRGLNGRLWDITEPLLRVCKMVYPEGLDDLKRALLDVARSRIEDKAQDIEGRIVTIIDDLSPKGQDTWEIWTSDVLDKLNEDRPEGHKYTAPRLGKKLKAMGLKTRITNGHSRIMLESQDFRTLQAQYKIPEHATSDGHSLMSLHSLNLRATMSCEGDSESECFQNSRESHCQGSLAFVGSSEFSENSESFEEVGRQTFFSSSLQVIDEV